MTSVEAKREFLKGLVAGNGDKQRTIARVSKRELAIDQFYQNQKTVKAENRKAFGLTHLQGQLPEVQLKRVNGDVIDVINMASYNYLGLGSHPEVIAAAKQALDEYGLGACASPTLAGTLSVHETLVNKLLAFYQFDNQDYDVSIFSSGFGALLGAVSALVGKGDVVFLDQYAHASIADGAKMSDARIVYYRHNDMVHLEQLMKEYGPMSTNKLICTEGVFSADGDAGELGKTVEIARQYGAKVLVDEAHSALISGDNGRGECERQGVLNAVDFIALTFSKSFSGVGGALIGKRKYIDYVSFNARCRVFSCALDPAVTAGVTKSLELAASELGDWRRKKIKDNAAYFREKLSGKVDVLGERGWVVPVVFGDESIVNALANDFHSKGLDSSPMLYPGVPRNRARMRLFVTSEHTEEQLDRAADIVLELAQKYQFTVNDQSRRC